MNKTTRKISKVTLDIRRTIRKDDAHYYYEVSFGGSLCYVRLYPFQEDMLDVYAYRKQVSCVYHGLNEYDGTPKLSQDRNALIDELYEEDTVHEFVYLRTETDYNSESQVEYHLLSDSFGLKHRFYAYLPDYLRVQGAKIKVYIRGINPKTKILLLSLYDSRRDNQGREWYDAEKVFDDINEKDSKEHFFDAYLDANTKCLSKIYYDLVGQYKGKSNLWLFTYMNFLESDVLRECYSHRDLEELASLCNLVIKIQTWMVEGSSFLDLFGEETRETTLTKAIRQITKYQRLLLAIDVVRNAKQYQYIGDIVSSLKKSGRLVVDREERQEVMINILRIFPEYISKDVESASDLIDCLINLEDEVGQSELTFIAHKLHVLVELNIKKIRKGTIRSNEIDTSQTLLIREVLMFLCLLVIIYSSKKYPDEIQARICKARFFRFLSFLCPKSVQPVVIKAGVDALVGVIDCGNIFTFDNVKSINPLVLSNLTAQATVLDCNTENDYYFLKTKGKTGIIRLDATGFTVVPYKHCLANIRSSNSVFDMIKVFHHLEALPLKLGTMYDIRPLSLDRGAVHQFLLWSDISKNPANLVTSSILPKPRIGDLVRVYVKEQNQPDKLKYLLFVIVRDKKYAAVDGVITPKEITGKWVSDCRKLFKPGQSFYAKVCNINDEGKYQFSIREEVDEYAAVYSTVEDDVQNIVLKDTPLEKVLMLPKEFIQELILLVDMRIRKEENTSNKLVLIGYAHILSALLSDPKSYYYDFLLRYYAVIEQFVTDKYKDVDIKFHDTINNCFVNIGNKRKLVELLSFVDNQSQDGLHALQTLANEESGNDVGKLSALLIAYINAMKDNLSTEVIVGLRNEINSLVSNPDELDLSALHEEEEEESADLESADLVEECDDEVLFENEEVYETADQCKAEIADDRAVSDIASTSIVQEDEAIPLKLNIFEDGSIMMTEDLPCSGGVESLLQIEIPIYALDGFLLLMDTEGGLCKVLVKDIVNLGVKCKQCSTLNPFKLSNYFVVPNDCLVGVQSLDTSAKYMCIYKSDDISSSSILRPLFTKHRGKKMSNYQPFILPMELEKCFSNDWWGKNISSSKIPTKTVDLLKSFEVYI